MNLIKRLKSYGKYVLGIAAISALVSQVFLPALSSNADGPRFNFMDNDYELFQGRNYTNHETVSKDPVSGEAGDVFLGYIYYHNGIEDSVAKNTTVKVTVPRETNEGSAKLAATISADNAQTVSDTIVGGKIVGKSGLTVNLNEDASVEFVPGSTKWFPEGSKEAVELPFGQNGDEIISRDGLNIGDIKGCWDYAGFVTFAFKTKEKVKPANLAIEKSVRNISRNQGAFAEITNASQNEKVEFKVDISNNGTGVAPDVIAWDKLPTDLVYLPGSIKLAKGNVIANINEQAYFNGGVNIGDLAPGEHAYITFLEQVPGNISESRTVTNVAYAKSCGITVHDEAKVCIEVLKANIVKSKSAWNITQNINAVERAAGPGDIIEYTLVTQNTGNAATEFEVSDGIADILEYANVINMSDGGQVVNGPANTNEAQIAIWPKVVIPAGGQIVNKFTVKIKNPLPENPQNGFHFDDKLFNVYGNEVVVCIARPVIIRVPDLRIDKFVRNVSKNELDFVKLNTAYAGDTLEYKITFTNVGNGPADYVKIYDTLPANVILDPSAPAIFSLNGVERSITENITDGYTIKTIMPGDSGYVRFRVLTDSGLAGNERLVNTGHLIDNNKEISAQAETVIKQKIVPTIVKALPKTGASLGIEVSAIASLFATANIMYLKKKKALLAAARRITLS